MEGRGTEAGQSAQGRAAGKTRWVRPCASGLPAGARGVLFLPCPHSLARTVSESAFSFRCKDEAVSRQRPGQPAGANGRPTTGHWGIPDE